jgi:hypothetical protein
MEASVKLYDLPFRAGKTYLWAAAFTLCNIALPQFFHLIPQGGIIFAPLSFVILVGAYKLGWRTGLLAALASPLINHLLFGQPVWSVLPVMALKLSLLALLAGFAAQRFGKVTLSVVLSIVLLSELLGGVGEWLLTGGIAATIADFTIGWPGLLLQIVGTCLVLHYVFRK